MKHATGEGEIYRASTAIARRPASTARQTSGASDRLNSRRLVFMLSERNGDEGAFATARSGISTSAPCIRLIFSRPMGGGAQSLRSRRRACKASNSFFVGLRYAATSSALRRWFFRHEHGRERWGPPPCAECGEWRCRADGQELTQQERIAVHDRGLTPARGLCLRERACIHARQFFT